MPDMTIIEFCKKYDNYFFINGIFQNIYGRYILFDKQSKTSRNVILILITGLGVS